MAVKSARVFAHSATAAACRISNDRDQVIDAVFSPKADGFTPLEIQAAALAACIAASVRIAARAANLGQLGEIDVTVDAIKAEDEPSRLGRFEVAVHFGDALDDATQDRLVEAAEDICTISNTLRAGDTVIAGHRAEPTKRPKE
ncbi:OsmC family protein [Aquamicrobium sp. LC103]|uniref:OsmC family protein n=1 Tax=Aquamicrobium sp. LC103 TaxID=1120658 RepID=UPI00069A32D6|nr:OsmC family protein [Aquamicrobium sp. LC103]TKT83001.1 OsmC family protein [Aquamicrobium sp. LC103]